MEIHHPYTPVGKTIYAKDSYSIFGSGFKGKTITNQVEQLLEYLNADTIIYIDSEGEFTKFTIKDGFQIPTKEEIEQFHREW